ncbi:MAG TPA: arylesterase [Gemmatimonadaceae bacterium]
MRSVKGTVAVLLLVSAGACKSEREPAVLPPKGNSADSTHPVVAAADARGTVLFLGTSLTAGLGLEPDSAYPQQLQHRIDAAGLPFTTVNAGVSGETSAGLLRRLDWVLQRPAGVVVVETGANDGLRGQPVAGTKEAIGQILTRIKHDLPNARVLLVQMEAPTNLGADYTRAFHAMFPALAREHGVTLLPFLLDSVAGRPSLNQADGVHPNYVGERIVTSNVWKGLEPVLRAAAGKGR